MNFTKMSCEEFVDALASKAPAPGGGGASAFVGALGVALGNMVGSLTIGKKKYADAQDDIVALKARADKLQSELLRLVERDAEVFEPLSKAYGMPSETTKQKAEKARVLESALIDACSAPLEIMERCCEAIDLHADFAAKGARIAISDVGVGVVLCWAALVGAALNVSVNAKSMNDRRLAEEMNKRAESMVASFTVKSNDIFARVSGLFKDVGPEG
jgi:formiminotetrahydrofolate cyclodeaminase